MTEIKDGKIWADGKSYTIHRITVELIEDCRGEYNFAVDSFTVRSDGPERIDRKAEELLGEQFCSLALEEEWDAEPRVRAWSGCGSVDTLFKF